MDTQRGAAEVAPLLAVHVIDWRLIQPGDGVHAPGNDRVDFSHVAGLAEDMRVNGQSNPCEVTPLVDGFHWLITGGSRWRACKMIDSPVRCLIVSASYDVQLEKMLAENVNRKDLDVMEESRAFASRLSAGWPIERLMRVTGKRRAYIESRVALTRLRDEIQLLVGKPGGLDPAYALALASYDLDANRQGVALATYRECKGVASLDWFRGICNTLAEEQATRGLFDLPMFGGALESYAPVVTVADLDTAGLPLPGVNSPPARGMTARVRAADHIAYWRRAESGWAVRGRSHEAALCKASADAVAALLATMPDDPMSLQPGAVERKTGRGKRGAVDALAFTMPLDSLVAGN